MRFLKYKCPNSKSDPLIADQCIYEWDSKTRICRNCGVDFENTKTIWNKIEDIYHTVIPYKYRPGNIWYAFKCRFFKKYTTIKPRKLGHEWVDRSDLLLHVMFEVFQRFMEEEFFPDQERKSWSIDWDSDTNRAKVRDEMLDLYRWWAEEYREEYEFVSLQEDERLQQVMLNNCKRLIDISPFLWT